MAQSTDKEWRAQSKHILCCLQSLFTMFLVRIIEVFGIFFAMKFIIFIMKEKQILASRVHREHLVQWFSAQVLKPLWSSEVETGVTVAISL